MSHIRTRTRSRCRDRGRALALLGALLIPALLGCQASDSDAQDEPSPTAAVTSAPAGEDSKEPSPTPTATGVEDPCALVTRQEAEQLAGTPLKPGKETGDTCTYVAPESGPTAQVEIFSGESGKNYYDAERQLGHELKTLDDIGDEAYLEDGSVFLRVGETWVSIRLVRGNTASENNEPLTALAGTVATRL